MAYREIQKRKGPSRTGHSLLGLLIGLVIVTGGLVLTGAVRRFYSVPRDRQRSAVVPSGEVREARRLPIVENLPEQAKPRPVNEEAPEIPGDESPRIRVDDRSVSELLDLARTTSDSWVKADVIEELAARRERDGVPAIVQFLHDGDPDVRRVAVDALADLDAENQVPAVRAVLAVESNRDVRAAIGAMLREVAGH